MWEGITVDSFSGILDGIKDLLPIIIPTVVGFIAFRKGFQFVKSQIKGA